MNLASSSISPTPGAHISIKSNLHTKSNQPFSNKIIPLFEMLNVTRISIDCKQIIPHMFFKILSLLPNLDSIRIISFPTPANSFILNENSQYFYLFMDNNKVTKLSLRDITNAAQIVIMFDVFPHIKFVEIQRISNYGIEPIIRCVLWIIQLKNNHPLKSICVDAGEELDDQVENLQKMIKSENLPKNSIIYRRQNKYYLEWK